VTGANDQVSPAIRFDTGAYVFTWTGTGGFVGITLTDAGDNTLNVLAVSGANGHDLFSVDNDQVKAGDIKLQVTSDAAWTVKIEKVDGSSSAALPQVLTAEEMKDAISPPVRLEAGTLTVSYTYKAAPKGTGTIQICDVATGKRLNGGLMYAGKVSGTLEIKVPSAGVYIARTTFPLASGGGEVKIAQ
jgi:hypothetical protein